MLKLIKLLFLLVLFLTIIPAKAQEEKKIFVLEIRSEIDPRMSRYVELALEEAKEWDPDLVLINMDTYGGTLDDADKIRTRILNYPIPIHTWINDNAASAGALIAISSDSIYMSPGANIGAATVVFGDGQPAPDKYQAYMRSKMRSTAKAQGRDPEIASGMVGETIGKDSITVGNVISLTTDEAIEAGYSEGEARSLEAVVEKHLGIEDYELRYFELSTAEKVIKFFLNPYLQGILLLIMIGGIYFELQTPGIGFPIMAAGVAAILYFLPNYLNGLAEYWEIILFVIGLILIAVEIFVLPGFGVAGISGITLVCASLVLVLLNNDALNFEFVPAEAVMEAFTILFTALGGVIILVVAGGTRMLESKAFKRIMLEDSMASKEGWTSNFNKEDLMGKTGTAWTVLRPSGKVMIDDVLYDASTRGEWIEKGKEIAVIAVPGTSLRVKEKV